MRYHPLTPMLDSDLPRVLGAQTDGRVGLGLVQRWPVARRWRESPWGSDAARVTGTR